MRIITHHLSVIQTVCVWSAVNRRWSRSPSMSYYQRLEGGSQILNLIRFECFVNSDTNFTPAVGEGRYNASI